MKENWKKAKKITNVGNNSFVELMKCRKSLFSIFNILKPIDCCQIRIYSGAATLHSPLCIFCMLNYTRGAHHNCKQGERTRYIIQTAVLVPTSSSVQSCEKIRIRFKSYAVVFLYTLLYTAFQSKKGLYKSIKETFTSMQMKAKLTSQNHDLDTKYRLFVNIVASIFAGKMKVFRPTGYQELQAKPT